MRGLVACEYSGTEPGRRAPQRRWGCCHRQAAAADDLAMVELLIAGCEPPMGPAEISGWRSAHRLRAAFA